MNISPPHREKNGRRQRSTQVELNEINKLKSEAEQSQVKNQPHRKGNPSPMAESAIGRFVIQFSLESQLYDAALEYSRIRGMWLAAIGAPRDEKHGGSGNDLTIETVHKWRDSVSEWREAMKEAGGKNGVSAVEYMVCDNMDFPHRTYETLATINSLKALAKAMGKI